MQEKRREIIAGRAFYFMPSPFFAIKITAEEKYNHEKMTEVIGELEKVHPIINNVVVREDGCLWFQDAGKHVSIFRYTEAEAEDWKTVYKTELSDVADLSKEPGIRVAILEHSDCFDLLILFHHIYGDGISIKTLLSDLIYIYCTGKRKAPKEALTDFREDHLKGRFPVSRETNGQIKRMRKLRDEKEISFDFESFRKMNLLHNKLVRQEITIGSIEATEFRRLKERCREYNVTVNSALATAILAGIREDDGVRTIIPVNVRPLLGLETVEGLANLASSVNTDLRYQQELSFWENVTAVHASIKAALEDLTAPIDRLYTFACLDENVFGIGYHAQYGMYRDFDVIKELREVLKLDIEKKMLDFSNVGELVLETTHAHNKFRECYVVPNFTITCDRMFGTVSMEDTLRLSFVYSSRRISCKAAEEIMDRIIGYLREEGKN